MNTTDVSGLLARLLASAGLPDDPQRESLRVWAHSGVERLRFADGESVVFKYADTPFDNEHIALRLAASHGVPVPALRTSRTISGLLGMLLEDLGEPMRDADDRDGAHAAVHLHQVADGPSMTRLDATTLAGPAPADHQPRATTGPGRSRRERSCPRRHRGQSVLRC